MVQKQSTIAGILLFSIGVFILILIYQLKPDFVRYSLLLISIILVVSSFLFLIRFFSFYIITYEKQRNKELEAIKAYISYKLINVLKNKSVLNKDIMDQRLELVNNFYQAIFYDLPLKTVIEVVLFSSENNFVYDNIDKLLKKDINSENRDKATKLLLSAISHEKLHIYPALLAASFMGQAQYKGIDFDNIDFEKIVHKNITPKN